MVKLAGEALSRACPHQQAKNNDSCSKNTTHKHIPSPLSPLQAAFQHRQLRPPWGKRVPLFLDLWVFYRCVFVCCVYVTVWCVRVLKGRGKESFSLSWVRWGQRCQVWSNRVGWAGAVAPPPEAPSALPAGKARPIKHLTTHCTQLCLLICEERLDPAGLWSS